MNTENVTLPVPPLAATATVCQLPMRLSVPSSVAVSTSVTVAPVSESIMRTRTLSSVPMTT